MYITETYYQGILTLSTTVDGYTVKHRYLYYSKRQAYKMFRQYVKEIKKGVTQ